MSPQVALLIVQALRMLPLVLENIPQARADYDELVGDLERMVREGRNPTPKEWDKLNRKTDNLQERIMGGTNTAEGGFRPPGFTEDPSADPGPTGDPDPLGGVGAALPASPEPSGSSEGPAPGGGEAPL